MKTPSRFDYIKYDEQSANEQAFMKDQVEFLEARINHLNSPRYKVLALTALEECYMWIGKAIRDDQVARNKETVLNETREPEFELKYLTKTAVGYEVTELCPYKAPEQVMETLIDIKNDLRVGAQMLNDGKKVIFFTHDYGMALKIEHTLTLNKLLK